MQFKYLYSLVEIRGKLFTLHVLFIILSAFEEANLVYHKVLALTLSAYYLKIILFFLFRIIERFRLSVFQRLSKEIYHTNELLIVIIPFTFCQCGNTFDQSLFC